MALSVLTNPIPFRLRTVMLRTVIVSSLLLLPGLGYGDETADKAAAHGGHADLPSLKTLQAQADEQWGVVESYCLGCHNQEDWYGKLALDLLGPDSIAKEPETFEKVVRKLRGHMMPPPGQDRPENEKLDAFVAWLEASLDQSAATGAGADIGLHRLNRTEYANAIRDLLALDVDPATLLPVDGAEGGFDNIASALQVSPTFIDQSLNAARVISAQAVGNPETRPGGTPYIFGGDQRFYVEGLPLGTRGGGMAEHWFPVDGEYYLNIGDIVSASWGFNQEHVNTIIATLDDEKFFEMELGGGDQLREIDQLGPPAVEAVNAKLKNIAFTTTAGPHRLAVTFLHRSFTESDQQLELMSSRTGQEAVLSVRRIEIFGPINNGGLSTTPSREKVFSCYPGNDIDEAACAEKIISDLTQRAFRGLASDEDMAQLLPLYELGYDIGGFEKGITFALSGILSHPKFLYRMEPLPDDQGTESETVFPLSGVELASRLSFFLWSTIPDEELMTVALDGTLTNPEVLEQQMKRMLADPRSVTLASNFAYQWLGLGELSSIDPDPLVFNDVDGGIRDEFITETRMFVDSIFREDRSILDLLTADHTYLNEELALHYGIGDVRGSQYRRVTLKDENRWGLLGKGGILMVSSYPNRTSPVLRGAWLMENLMGTPPPAPPPDVEGLPEDVQGEEATTVRARLEAHRANPSCNGCHGIIDPLGFSLENFDAVGRWRESDRFARTPIDASGTLPDGTKVGSPIALRKAILARPEQFAHALVEKLMTYALGRTLDYRDMPTVRRIIRESAEDDYRFSTLVRNIVDTDQFRMKYRPGNDEFQAQADVAKVQSDTAN